MCDDDIIWLNKKNELVYKPTDNTQKKHAKHL